MARQWRNKVNISLQQRIAFERSAAPIVTRRLPHDGGRND
jgi:hypothetical protein